MRMNISAWAIRNPIPPLVLFAVLLLLGTVTFLNLPITRMPNVDVPFVSVTISQPGAAPGELETQVTKKVEDAISGVTGVRHQTSTITDGISTTAVEFHLETPTDRAVNDVKDAITKIRADLPRNIDEPQISRIEIEGGAIMTYGVSAKTRSAEEISWFIDDTVIRTLKSANGVASVTRMGGVDREIRIALDPDRLAALGITAGDVNRQLRATNVNLAGGRGEIAGQEQMIRTLAGATRIEDLASMLIALPGGRKVELSSLGTITDAGAEERQFARLDGQPVVAFAVFRGKGKSDASVSEAVEAKVAELGQAHPDFRFTIIDNSVNYTLGNFHSAMETLLEGAALAVLVVFLFLRDWRATLIAAVALPLSALPTFWAISMLGFSLNLVSLLAITLSTGVLVDDAIVEIENIARHMRMGKSAYRAAIDGADEIGLAVIAITLTIVAVFAPVSFMSGIAGQYFKQFGLTVAISVIFSLLVARLVTPMLAAYFMRNAGHDHDQEEGRIIRAYTRLVRASVRHRWITLFLGLGIFAGSMQLMVLLPTGLMPPVDESRMMFTLELPPGSRLSDTREVTDRLARKLKENPEIDNVLVNGGYVIGTGGSEVRKATLTINLVHKSKRQRTQKDMEHAVSDMLAATPDIRFWFTQSNGLRALSLIVAGEDDEAINRVAAQLQSGMKTLPMIANPVSTAALDRPEIQIRPRMALAAELGVTSESLAETIRVATIGDVSVNLAKFDAGDRLVPIRVQLPEEARADLQALESLKVATARGVAVPLSAVADISFDRGPAAISRYDRVRRVAVEADLVGNAALGQAVSAIMDLPAARNLPPGVTIRQAGDAEIMGEIFSGFAMAMGAGIMIVFGVLVLLFRSILQPITILFALPLSLGGVVIGLLLASMSFSMPVVIGFLMLMGIVTKNSIMLVEFALERMNHGMSRLDAIVDAGAKRARPIVMTTIAMAAGMVPSMLALGDGGEFRSPMAVAVVGGLLVSTLLSLIFVPALFTIMDSLGNLAWRGFSRFVGPRDEPPAARPGTAPSPAE